MPDHTRTEKIGGDSIIILVVIQVIAGNGYDKNVVLGGMIPAGTGFKGLVHRSRQHNNILFETKKKKRISSGEK